MFRCVGLVVVVACGGLGFAGRARAAAFPVLDGGRQATIVYADDARDEAVRAYKDLAAYLKRSTGKAFATLAEKDFTAEAGKHPIYVGMCKALSVDDRARLATKMDRDAYLVRVTPDAVHLVGPRPWSTYWAVCQFLEDHVGVRWLIPGPLGDDVPKHGRIVVRTGERVFTPKVLSRLWSGAHYGGAWSLRQRIHARYRFHHNLLNVFNPDKLYDRHPTWFPQRSGKRYRPSGLTDHSWQPCFASASSVKHAADVARAAWKADPDLESYSYGCNDGQGWCECDGCKATDRDVEPWDGFDGSRSYRFYTWLNKVAAELAPTDPEKMLGCLAYSTYILPPEDIGLHKNIIPYLTSNRADYYEPEFRKQDQKLLEWWGRVAHQVGIYDYAYGMGFAIPRIYTHLFQEAIRHAVKHRVRGFYAEVYPNWGLDGPKLYAMARVLWDPDTDVDALVDDWNDRMFREAAGPMKQHFARCERAWREQDTGRGHWAYRLAAKPKQFKVFPPAVLAECTGYLDAAAALAKSEIVKKRIHFFRKTWDVTLLLAGAYWAASEAQALLERGAPLSEIAAALRKMADRMATVDVDAVIKEKVGADPIAFHPPKPSWISPLKGGAATQAKRWSASLISKQVVTRARAGGKLDAAELRKRIAASVDEAFGTGGSPAYRKQVAQIRAMSLKVAAVVKAKTAPRIDGVPDEPLWGRTDELGDFIRWGQSAASAYTTHARLAHDGAMLYVALECVQDTSKLVTLAAPRDGATWKDDSVELFINPTLDEFPHVQFIINAKGAFFDQWPQRDGQSYSERLSANFNCRWAAKVHDGKWTAELALPLAEFGCGPATHPLLRLNLVRNVQGKKAEISAWFSSVGAHADPASRGWLVLE